MTRDVIGVMCPTVLAQRLGLAQPIFVSLGDVIVDWSAPTSASYRVLCEGLGQHPLNADL